MSKKYRATITIVCTDREDLEGALYAAGGSLMDIAKLAALKKALGGSFDWTILNVTNVYTKDDLDAPSLVKERLKGVIETTFHYEEIEDEGDNTDSEVESEQSFPASI